MQTVGPHQGEEAGQEGAAIRTEAFSDQVMEFVDFHPDEAQAQQEGHCQPADNALLVALVHRQHGETVGDTTEQQAKGFYQHVRQFKDVFARRATIWTLFGVYTGPP